MIDVKLLRTAPEVIKDSLARRGLELDVDALGKLDAEHRALLVQVETARAEQNSASKAIAKASADDRAAAITEAKRSSDALKSIEEQLRTVKAGLDSSLALVPNLLHPDSPAGFGEDANAVLSEPDTLPTFNFEARDHVWLGEATGVIDVERAAKVSGSRFGFLKGKGALLELALVNFAIAKVSARGFTPVIPPVLVREEAMYGTGFFPTDETQTYKTATDDLFLAGTSEVPLASMHADETFDPELLPLRYAAFSSCFRREAGTYGKDTKGIIRLHQFEKVEMFVFCRNDASEEMHDEILSIEKEIFSALEIPYRVVEICAGDLGAPAYRKFDLEAWLPGAKRWLEITSCSNCTDYQARRLNIKTRTDSGQEMVHTLNGTAVAVQRAIVSLLENHQRSDGSVVLPPALAEVAGFDTIGP
ncbi:MAG: serine--tRNA ligase [Actinomycetota bacterium]|nr:serine--tRNA ligase [Actinomycetota bacterium]